ncbi:ATP-binding protein [Paenibacillus sp. RC67]|uniref:sensor histidine kinase n=1 Tax=Paenibacillus sp. RC67 TaxID=3039392 RepID=UPI0024AE129E|nr:ATP-binding protein [Paenibacillus sp. RC67]
MIFRQAGIGIEREKLKQLLTPDPGAEPNSRSGVGLQNIGKRLKYMYGTELSIESTAGVGTKVTVSVPIQAM